jgi:cytochrome c oxidase subunit 4
MMASHSEAHAHGDHEHPGPGTYGVIALILTVITIAEVSAYYIPAWETSSIYVPSMLSMSALKFFLVVAYYMHLKYDHKLFKALFSGPLLVAALTLIGLLFLFSKLVIRLGLLN